MDADGLRVRATVLDQLTPLLARSARARRYPLDLQGTSSYVEERRIQIPAGMTVLSLPEGGTAESPYGTLVLRVEQRGPREIAAHTELSLTRDVIPQSEYEAFRRWVEAADLLLRQRISLGGQR